MHNLINIVLFYEFGIPTSGTISFMPTKSSCILPLKTLSHYHHKFLLWFNKTHLSPALSTFLRSGHIAIILQMSKRKSSADRANPLSLELDEEQIAALQLIPHNLHPNLKCLSPVLQSIWKAYSNSIPLHRRVLPVNTTLSHYQKTILTS